MASWSAATAYRLTQPFRIEAVEREVKRERADDVLVRPRMTGVCASDLKLYAGTRDRRALSRKLPIALLHEGVGEVVESGPSAGHRPGTRVVVVPNIPCYVAYPERYHSRAEACAACRPGGAGENYCLDHLYLSSNTDGLAQTVLRHPGALVVPVPPDVPDEIAVLTEPLTTIVAGCEKVGIRPGCRCLILGNGPLALLVAVALGSFYGVQREAICMSGHGWEFRAATPSFVGSVVDATDPDAFAALRDGIDVAFECVGGDANQDTLEQAIECLRPGGTAVLFGPSERSIPFNTREVIGKGLAFVGRNRSYVPHFAYVTERLREPGLQALLAQVRSPEHFYVRTAEDLNHALYHAWTKRDGGKTVIAWGGPE